MTQRAPASKPTETRSLVTGELSDDDLEHVVGGLTRTWEIDARPAMSPAIPPMSVSLLGAADSTQRISA